MALLADLDAKRVEMNNAIDAYKQAVADLAAGSIAQTDLDNAKALAQTKGDEFAKLMAQVKKDDANVTNDDQLFSVPGLQNAGVRSDVAAIMTTGSFLGDGLAMLVDTEGNAANATEIVIPLKSGSSVTVDWGDGTALEAFTGEATHNYGTPGQYTVKVTGTVNGFNAPASGNTRQIKDVLQWGTVQFDNLDRMFMDRLGFTISASDAPAISPGASMYAMFYRASDFNSPIGHWDVSNVVTMGLLFREAAAFNQPLNSWDVVNVTNVAYMFQDALLFNQPLNTWNTANASLLTYMFYNAQSFDQDISMWPIHSTPTASNFADFSPIAGTNKVPPALR